MKPDQKALKLLGPDPLAEENLESQGLRKQGSM